MSEQALRPGRSRPLGAGGFAMYARTRQLDAALGLAVLTAVLVGAAGSVVLRVPFAPESVVVEAYLLAPVVPVAVLAGTLGAPLAALEDVAAETLRRLRMQHVAVLLGALAGLLWLAALPGTADPRALVRNGLALLGAALLFAVVVTPDLAWTAAVLPAALCFFLGKSHDDDSVLSWALLLHEGSSRPALAIGLLLAAAGAAAYAVHGPARRV